MSRLKKKRGVVMMMVITIIVFLVVIVQQMAHDSFIEFQNESLDYQSKKAYHAAKSGLELTLLKIIIYMKIQNILSLNKKNIKENLGSSFSSQIQFQLQNIWRKNTFWPLILPEDLDDIRRGEFNNQVESSFMKDVSYGVKVENEGSKLNIEDLSSHNLAVRQWMEITLYNLMLNLSQDIQWLGEEYDPTQLKEIVTNISKTLHPVTGKGALMDLNDLVSRTGMDLRVLELIKPYVTIYGEHGVNLQFSSSAVIQSLHGEMTKEGVKKIKQYLRDQQIFLSSLEDIENLFKNLGFNFMLEKYFNEDPYPLASFVFSFDHVPHNFKIRSYGKFKEISKGIEATLYNPLMIKRSIELLERQRQKSDYFSSIGSTQQTVTTKGPKFTFSPFIVEFKNITNFQ